MLFLFLIRFDRAMGYALTHLLILFLLPFSCSGQNNGRVNVGRSLTATRETTPWLSPSGDFAFGFKQLQELNQFLLSIWYAKIPQETIVWYANLDSPVPEGSTLMLNSQTGLVLQDPQSRILWRTDGILNEVAYGFMNDSGNFVLFQSDSVSLWESFRNPTDTLLPTQTMEIGSFLVSRQKESNFSQGRFYLRMQNNGNLALTTRAAPSNLDDDAEYYNSQTSDPANSTNSGYRAIFDGRGSLYVLKRNEETTQITPRSIPSTSDNYHRITLNFDGVLIQYYYPKNPTGDVDWTPLWSQPGNICLNIDGDKGSGACGYNNVCRLGENRRPVCECPKGYSLVDPNDKYGNCKANFTQSCYDDVKGSAEDTYDFVVLTDTDWPKSDYFQLSPSTEIECRNTCLHDCFCAVAIFRDNSCWKKKLPLSNGRIDTSLNAKAFLKYRKRDVSSLNPYNGPFVKKPKDRERLLLLVSILLGSSVFINILLVCAVCLGFYVIYTKKMKKPQPGNDGIASNLQSFTYNQLAEATNGFKEEVGRGAFGIVYKGVMPTGSGNIIAVKKLDRVFRDGEKEFKAEVNVIGQTYHKNLVRLLGYCEEGQNRLLVYEFMSNGTLAGFLFGDLKPSWSQRTTMALGIARGLTYLHEECCTQIIHCDIKPQNILLDEYYNARISDFGLAKLLGTNQSRTLTNIRGTKGYVAPEWFRRAQISVKVDVYSFGVLLLEIICCRRCLEDVEDSEGEQKILTDWVWDCFQERRFDTLVKNDREALNDVIRLERFVMAGIWCIQEDASLRPTMREVSRMLEGVVEVRVSPCPFQFNSYTT